MREPAQAVHPRRDLLAWYRSARRDLPWRRTSDPWAILVSEVMLQQTRVETVIPYFTRFLARFPDPASLATAAEGEVLGLWSGLGYYRRARNLQAAARRIVERHGGRFPSTLDGILDLPGVGRYTAGAVGSIAFGLPAPLVDGNVARVLARLYRVAGDPKSSATSRELWRLAEGLLDPDHPGDLNQALMELGATLCTPAAPRCGRCPVAAHCRAWREGVAERYPESSPRRASVPVHLAAMVLRRGAKVGLVRRAPGGRMAGLLDVPCAEVAEGGCAPELAARLIGRRMGLAVERPRPLGSVRHSITHHRIRIEVFEGQAGRREGAVAIDLEVGSLDHGIAPTPDQDGVQFFPATDVEALALSNLARKVLRLAGRQGATRATGSLWGQ